MYTENRDQKDPKAVLENPERQRHQGQHRPIARIGKEKVSGEQARNKQHQSRPDTAALFGNFYGGYAGELKTEPFAENGFTHHFEQSIAYLSRGVLKESIKAFRQKCRQRHHEGK